MRRPLAIALAASALVAAAEAHAAEEDDLPTGDEPPKVVPIAIVDAYWAWHDPSPAGRQATLLTTASRHDEFAVNLAAVGARLQHARLTGTVVLQAGTSVDAAAGNQPGREIWKHIQVANVGWKTGDWHLEAGVMPSLIGRESFVSVNNWNYTRAFVSDSTPYYVAGARVGYRLTPSFSIAATVFNGFSTFRNEDDHPSGNVYLAYRPGEKLAIEDSITVSPDRQATTNRTYVRLLEDLIVTVHPHAKVDVAAEGMFGLDRNALAADARTTGDEKKDPYFGAALLWLRWRFAKTTWVAARGEFVFDKWGVLTGLGAREPIDRFGAATAPGQRFLGGTLTLAWQPHPSFLARVEALHRVSDEAWFAGGDTFDPKKRSTTLVVSAAFAL